MSRKRSSSAITASRPSKRSTGIPRWSNARIAEARCATLPSATSTSVSTASLSPNGGQGFESSVCAAPADGRNGDMPKLKPGHVSPTPDEDYAINAAVAADPETSELDDAWFKRARPASEVVPHIVRRYRRTRGKQRAPTKTQITLLGWCSTSRAGRRASTRGPGAPLPRNREGLADARERHAAQRGVRRVTPRCAVAACISPR